VTVPLYSTGNTNTSSGTKTALAETTKPRTTDQHTPRQFTEAAFLWPGIRIAGCCTPSVSLFFDRLSLHTTQRPPHNKKQYTMTRPKGPLGIDPLTFSLTLFGLLLLFVLYLLLPRALRKQYFGAYPRRHAWSARSRARRSRGYGDVSLL
jgi:hypothetical protein